MKHIASRRSFPLAPLHQGTWGLLLALWVILLLFAFLGGPHRQSPDNPVPWWVVVLFGTALLPAGLLSTLAHREIRLEGDTLVVAAALIFVRKVPIRDLALDKARVLDLDEHTEFRPMLQLGFRDYMDVAFQLHQWRREESPLSRKSLRNRLRTLPSWMDVRRRSVQGAALKGWVESRIGLPPTFHKGPIDDVHSEAYVMYLADRVATHRRYSGACRCDSIRHGQCDGGIIFSAPSEDLAGPRAPWTRGGVCSWRTGRQAILITPSCLIHWRQSRR